MSWAQASPAPSRGGTGLGPGSGQCLLTGGKRAPSVLKEAAVQPFLKGPSVPNNFYPVSSSLCWGGGALIQLQLNPSRTRVALGFCPPPDQES